MSGTVEVRLDATWVELDEVAGFAAQIPLAASLEPGARVVVAATATRSPGMLGRIFGARKVEVPRAVRCTALLVRGYVGIGADDAAAWGRAPGEPPGPA